MSFHLVFETASLLFSASIYPILEEAGSIFCQRGYFEWRNLLTDRAPLGAIVGVVVCRVGGRAEREIERECFARFYARRQPTVYSYSFHVLAPSRFPFRILFVLSMRIVFHFRPVSLSHSHSLSIFTFITLLTPPHKFRNMCFRTICILHLKIEQLNLHF